MTTPLDPHASGQRARRGARPARAQRPRRACPAARAASTAQVVVYVPGRYKAVGVSETSGAGGTTRQLRIRVAWLSPRAGMGCMLSLGLAVLCGANLHEIVERLVEGEGGGGGRGCASGRFALAVAGQACSCRNARHGRRVFVGALVAFLAKKRVKKARGSTTVRIRLFWVCESQIPPKPSWRRARETRRRHRQVGCLLFALGR